MNLAFAQVASLHGSTLHVEGVSFAASTLVLFGVVAHRVAGARGLLALPALVFLPAFLTEQRAMTCLRKGARAQPLLRHPNAS